jgi:hypothetical protein
MELKNPAGNISTKNGGKRPCRCMPDFWAKFPIYIHPFFIALPISSPVLPRLFLWSIFLRWVSTVCLLIFNILLISLLSFPSIKSLSTCFSRLVSSCLFSIKIFFEATSQYDGSPSIPIKTTQVYLLVSDRLYPNEHSGSSGTSPSHHVQVIFPDKVFWHNRHFFPKANIISDFIFQQFFYRQMGEKINYCTPDTQNQERSSG